MTMAKKRKKKRIRIKKKPIILFLLIIIVAIGFCYYLINIPMNRIIIEGNRYLSEYDIITKLEIKDYPNLYQLKLKDLKNKLMEESSVTKVNISRTLSGKLIIKLEESRVLFYNRYSDTVVYASKVETKDTKHILGIPILVNNVPKNEYQQLIEELAKVNESTLSLISEIEYNPWKTENTVVDNTRFLLRMNDGNQVHINLINIEKLNTYISKYATIEEGQKGTIYFDSSFGEGFFQPY